MKRNIRIIFTAIILAMVLAVALCACDDSIDGTVGGENNTAAEEQTTAGGTSIADLKGIVDGLKGTIAELESKVSGLDEKIKAIEGGTGSDELKASLEQLRKDTGDKIEEISKSVDALSANIASQDWVNETFATLEEHKVALDDIALIRTDIDTVNSAISDLETDIADKVAQINDIISNLAEKTELEEQISDITNEYTSAIENAREEICDGYMTEISNAIFNSEQTIKDWVKAEYDETISDILFRLQYLESWNENLVTRVNCLEGHHEWDASQTTYEWHLRADINSSECETFLVCKNCGNVEQFLNGAVTYENYVFTADFTNWDGCTNQTYDIRDISGLNEDSIEAAVSILVGDGTGDENGEINLSLNIPKIEGDGVYKAVVAGLAKAGDGKVNITIKGVDTIIGSAFSECKKLKSVTLGDEVKCIEYQVFSGCSELCSISFGSGIEEIGDNAFASCVKLTSVVIPDSVTSIDERVFYNCSGLESITLGSGITVLKDQLFHECYALKSITFRGVITKCENQNVFPAVKMLGLSSATLIFAEGQKVLVLDEDTNKYVAGEELLYGGNEFCEVTFEGIVTTFAIDASEMSVEQITGAVTDVVEKGVANLTVKLATDAGEDEVSAVTGAINNAYYGDNFNLTITGVAKMLNTFYNYSWLESITFSDGITTLGGEYNVMYMCGGLKYATIGKSVTSINGRIFYDCGSLEKIVYEGTVEEWNAIEKVDGWIKDCPDVTEVICSDGTIPLT